MPAIVARFRVRRACHNRKDREKTNMDGDEWKTIARVWDELRVIRQGAEHLGMVGWIICFLLLLILWRVW
jgi:hypothetical protein